MADSTPYSPFPPTAMQREPFLHVHEDGHRYEHVPEQQDHVEMEKLHQQQQHGVRDLGQEELNSDYTADAIKPRRSFYQWLVETSTYGWVPEIFFCALSVVALVAIYAVLRVYDKQPLPEWPSYITINALVSVFAVILKAGVLLPVSFGLSQLKWQWFAARPRKLIDLDEFDAASRGLWGSFLFLWRPSSVTSALHWLAKIAAFITIVGVAIDPFIQQVIHYVPCTHDDKSLTGTVVRSNTAIYQTDPDNLFLAEDSDLKLTINNALTNPSSSGTGAGSNVKNTASSILDRDCPTGNCTFSAFSTIAVCHTCQDISFSIIKGDPRPTEFWDLNHGNFSLPASDEYSLPAITVGEDGVLVTTGRSDDYPMFAMNMLVVPTQGKPTGWDYFQEPLAFSCQINPCIRTVEANVASWVLNEFEIGRTVLGYNNDQPWSSYVTVYDLAGKSYIRASTGEDGAGDGDGAVIVNPAGPNDDGTSDDDGEEDEDDDDDKTDKSSSSSPCTPSSSYAPGLIEVPLANVDLSPSNSSSSSSSSSGETAFYPEHCVWFFEGTISDRLGAAISEQIGDLEIRGGVSSSLTATRLWNNNGRGVGLDTTNSAMSDLTDAISALLRNRGTPSNGTDNNLVKGPAQVLTTCVDVQWPWFSYPVALVVMSVVWLTVVLVQSPTGEVTKRGWKQSSLAVLLAGVPEERLLTQQHGDGEGRGGGGIARARATTFYDTSRHQMESMASSIKVQLVRDHEGKARFM